MYLKHGKADGTLRNALNMFTSTPKNFIKLLNKSTKSVSYRIEILYSGRGGQHRLNMTPLRPPVENTY